MFYVTYLIAENDWYDIHLVIFNITVGTIQKCQKSVN